MVNWLAEPHHKYRRNQDLQTRPEKRPKDCRSVVSQAISSLCRKHLHLPYFHHLSVSRILSENCMTSDHWSGARSHSEAGRAADTGTKRSVDLCQAQGYSAGSDTMNGNRRRRTLPTGTGRHQMVLSLSSYGQGEWLRPFCCVNRATWSFPRSGECECGPE